MYHRVLGFALRTLRQCSLESFTHKLTLVLFVLANFSVCPIEGDLIRNSTPVLAHPSRPPTKLPEITSYCQGCSLRRAELEKSLTEDEITALRIQRVKQQILNKLRLKEPPKVAMAFSALPKPLTMGSAVHQAPYSPSQEDGNMGDSDDFYGKTNQVILFPQPNEPTCDAPNSMGSKMSVACFTFDLPAGLDADTVTTAVLWLYKRPSDARNQLSTFVISEIVSDSFSTDSKHLAKQSVATREGWFKIDLARPVNEWLRWGNGSHTISVTCVACSSSVGQFEGQRPFLIVNTSPALQRSRSKRHMNCAAGMSDCCREKLYISFADIGWDDWILQPAGYDAYYCRGSCSSAASLTLSASHYNTIIRKFLRESTSERSVQLVPCCTPTRLAPLQLLYVDDNQTITQKTLPNMVVSSCGCM